ncbi:MerR family transcriptional regulator [Actinophytocola sediminis]
MKSSALTIGEVAAHFALPTHVLRHWESVGLLAPARSASTHRRYTTEDLYRVATILRTKEVGFSLADIREFLAPASPPARKEVLARHRESLRARLAELRSAMDLVDNAIACTHEDITTCPNYRAHLEERLRTPARHRSG